MTDCISNLIELRESGEDIENPLHRRRVRIPEYSMGLGPPDMCFLIKETRTGFLGNTKLKYGYYHFPYGVDTSNSASVAAYMTGLFSKSEIEGGWKKNSKRLTIPQAVFCIYDIVFRRDIRVIVSIPGRTEVYSIDTQGNKNEIQPIDWTCAFVSSTLRAFSPKEGPGFRILPELNTKHQFLEFLHAARSLYHKQFQLSPVQDKVKTGINDLIGNIVEYLLTKYRIKDCMELLEPLIQDDPILTVLLSDTFLAINKIKECVVLLAERIKEAPYTVPFLNKQANALLKCEYYDYALKLAKISVELCPESFECWYTLAQCYFKLKQMHLALIVLDICPVYQETNFITGYPIGGFAEHFEHTEPKLKTTSECFSELLITPTKLDFRPNEKSNEEIRMRSRQDSEREEKLMQAIDKNPHENLSQGEQKIYELLVKIEKEIGWNALVNIKLATFYSENDYSEWDNPRDLPQTEKNLKTDASFIDIREAAKGLDKEYDYPKTIEPKLKLERRVKMKRPPEESDSYDISHSDEEDKGHPTEGLPKGGIQEERKESLKEKSLITKVREQAENRDPRDKRVNTKLDTLLLLLHEDLALLQQWELEEYHKATPIYSGKLWLRRGLLAERLNRQRKAEHAYRIAAQKGYSFLAWYRLLIIYSLTYNPKACIVCISEILHQAKIDGIHHFTKFPNWMENVLNKMICKYGLKDIRKMVAEMDLDESGTALDQAFENAQLWRVQGYDYQSH